jgi:hypothetical protein
MSRKYYGWSANVDSALKSRARHEEGSRPAPPEPASPGPARDRSVNVRDPAPL